MKKLVHVLVLSGLVGVPTLALAEDAPASPHTFSANVSLTSDYIFRGVSQTQNQPAIQGGFDYSHASGFYLGTWASNVGWVSTGIPKFEDNNSMEIDFYGGYKGKVGEDFGYDLGVITYYYPGDGTAANDPNTTELYIGGSWKFLSAKYSYAVSNHLFGWGTESNPSGDTDGSYYIELNASYPIKDGWGVLGHVGYQSVKDNDPATYTDWKLGVTWDIGFGVFTAAYTDTNAEKAAYTWDGEKVADANWFISFGKTF